MKKFTLFIGLLISQISFSQGFVSENKLWHVKEFSWDIVNTEIYKIEGDTVINSMSYKKLWHSYDSAMNEIWPHGLLREDSGIVYYHNTYFNEDYVLYDFTLEPGDTAYVYTDYCGEWMVVIDDVDTVEYFGVPRKRWILDGWTGDYWIEGIGSNYGLFNTKLYECVADIYKVLTCYHENDTLFYIQEGEVECFQTNVGIADNPGKHNLSIRPNPVLGGQPFVIQCDDGINEVEIYNVYGEKVNCFKFDSTLEAIITTNDLGPDLYLIRIHTGKNDFLSGKIIIR